MGVIRTIAEAIFLACFLIAGIPVSLVVYLIGKRDPARADRISAGWVRAGFRIVWAITGAHARVIGLESVPRDRAVLYIANHSSIFDVVMTGWQTPGVTGYIAKNSLEKAPLLRGWMRRIHCLFLDRSDVRQGMEVILAAIELMKQGISVFVFPEGTRGRVPGELLPFHAGSFKIAVKAGAPIIPVTIVGMHDIFEPHIPGIRPVDVTVVYGEPIETKDMTRDEIKALPDRVRDIIMETYAAHGGAGAATDKEGTGGTAS